MRRWAKHRRALAEVTDDELTDFVTELREARDEWRARRAARARRWSTEQPTTEEVNHDAT